MKDEPQDSCAEGLRIVLPKNSGPVIKNIARVFTRQVESRCGVKVTTSGKAPLTVELAIEPGIGAEGFIIADGKDGAVRIIGNDERGLLYGVGKFLRTSRYDRGGFTPGTWRGSSVPEKALRGIYFATHFYNYYQTAPVDEIERYVEELALWGVNTVTVWYDMHHFRGFNDPAAVKLRECLICILQTARRLGLSAGLLVIGNEAYADSPLELRADPTAQRGGYYDEAVCPNKPGGLEYTLKILGELFDWARDLRPEYVCIWPYDQGGCGCAKCKPWGSNGFLRCAEQVAGLARRIFPGVKIILSSWLFDAKEWQAVKDTLANRPSWVDMILAEDANLIKSGLPAGFPVIGFPEISMEGMWPWGGFGANPQPARFAAAWEDMKNVLAGGLPYSEGIFEDMNKVLWAQMYWNSARSADDILREYIAYEYAPDVTDDVLKIVHTLEQNHHFRWWPGKLEGVKLTMNWFPSKGSEPQEDPGAEETYELAKRVDAALPERARRAWRWRILFIRALLDSELKSNDGKPNEACMAGFHELMKICHTTDKSDPGVRPPIGS
jgi:hypothetical protein